MKTDYPRLPEDKYKKLLFQTRGQFDAIFNVFRCYGLNSHVDEAIDECMKLTEKFGMAVRGKDKPVIVVREPKRRAT